MPKDPTRDLKNDYSYKNGNRTLTEMMERKDRQREKRIAKAQALYNSLSPENKDKLVDQFARDVYSKLPPNMRQREV